MKNRILAYLTIFNIGGNNIQLNIVYLQSLTNSFKKLDVERKKKWLIVADVDGRFPIEY